MKRFLFGAGLLFAAAGAQEFRLGTKIADFTVNDPQGNPVHYDQLKGDTTVVMFIATRCPVSNAYNERMNALYKDYAAKGVHFIFVNANATEPAVEVQDHARQHGFAFPVYKDVNNQVADRFGAQVTPEAFAMDRTGTIRYHGSIDDAQNPARITKQSLRAALDALRAGQPVSIAETKAFGCTIRRVKRGGL